MTTVHLGDCLNGCDTCSENHHSEVVNSTCPTCGDYIEGKLDNTAECNLCGNHIEDINTAGIVLPWGDTCSNCLTSIYGENHQEKKESVCKICKFEVKDPILPCQDCLDSIYAWRQI